MLVSGSVVAAVESSDVEADVEVDEGSWVLDVEVDEGTWVLDVDEGA